MTTKALADYKTAIRYELSDAGTFWSDNELAAAVSKIEGFLSRTIPKKMVKEFVYTHEVVDETLTISSSTGTLSNVPVEAKSEVLMSSNGLTRYYKGVDYNINYLTGVVTEIGSLLPDTTYKISYHKDPQRYPISITNLPNLIKINRVEYPAGSIPTTYVTSFDWVDGYLILNGTVVMATGNNIRIYYDAQWTGATTEDADYPTTLFKTGIIGASGNALLYKAEKYIQTSITAITTLTPPTSPTLNTITAPSDYSVSKPTSPTLGSTITPVTPVTPSFTAVETALTAIATAQTAAIAYLTSGAALVNTLTVGDGVASTYGQYGNITMEGAGHRTNEAITRLKQIEVSVSNYVAQVQAYSAQIQEIIGSNTSLVNKFSEEIENERLGVQNHASLVQKYQYDIEQNNILVAKYQQDVTKYNQQVQDRELTIRNYLDIAGRYLASGQAKINEFYQLVGIKPEIQQIKNA